MKNNNRIVFLKAYSLSKYLIYYFYVKGILDEIFPVIQGCLSALFASYLSEAG